MAAVGRQLTQGLWGEVVENPSLELSDLAIPCLQRVPKTKMEQLANLGASSLIRRFLVRDTSLYHQDPVCVPLCSFLCVEDSLSMFDAT